VVTVAQLRASGLTESATRRRVAAARLHRLDRGVYAVGHPGLSREGRWKAAVLACGAGAALSHRSAGELWGILEPVDRAAIHVTVPVAGGRNRRRGVLIHRRPSISRGAITMRDGIEVTRPSRTLADLRSSIPAGELRRAIRAAERKRLPFDPAALAPDRAASELELRFLELCVRARIPEPLVDVPIAGYRVDFLWPDERLIVETDGYRYHRGSVAFEDDHARDNRLMALDYDVLRFTYRRVVDEPEAVVALLRNRLKRSRRSL
jgi:Protein of unknown function (DUF559)